MSFNSFEPRYLAAAAGVVEFFLALVATSLAIDMRKEKQKILSNEIIENIKKNKRCLHLCNSSALRAADFGFLRKVKCLTGWWGFDPICAIKAFVFKYKDSIGNIPGSDGFLANIKRNRKKIIRN